MKERSILHCDLNSFYASVECLYRPELRNHPVAVAGDPEARHGIILTKNQIAKKYGITVGEAIWQAKKKCPDLIIVKPHYDLYQQFSLMVRRIFSDYTDRIEPFGQDEAWLDVTSSTRLFGNGEKIADKLRQRIYTECGITASVGVSWNKIFAKLGSDYKKPDATTVISRSNYRDIVFPLRADEMLYVGKKTYQHLLSLNIVTIGDLANTDVSYLKNHFGKSGEAMWINANGMNEEEVKKAGYVQLPKSVGNSITCPRDIENMEDLRIVVYRLSEEVGRRLREQMLEGRLIEINLRMTDLKSLVRQKKLEEWTNLNDEIAAQALALFQTCAPKRFPLRSIGIAVSDLRETNSSQQLNLFSSPSLRIREEKLDSTLDMIRSRFGEKALQRAVMKSDPVLSGWESNKP